MPTLKQKKVFKEVVNGSTISGAMVKAGYAPSTAHRTNKVTATKGWQELMKKHLPDSHLAKRHRQLLDKTELKKFFNHETGEWEEEDTGQPDTQAVSKALDMAYKLKNMYPKDDSVANKTLVLVISGETAERYKLNGISSSSNSEDRS